MAAPTVVTDDAINIGKNSATLAGHCTWADPGVDVSYVLFEWGKTTAYGNWTYWAIARPGQVYEHDITGLEEGTLYRFRMVGADGALRSYGADKTFTTTTVEPTPPPTGFMGWIVERLNNVSSFFYNVYLEAIGWPWPLWVVADWFYSLSSTFNSLAWDFWHFGGWVDSIQQQLANIIVHTDIWDIVVYFFPQIGALRDWFYSWWDNVTGVVTTWWSSTQSIVKAWVNEAKSWSTILFNQVSSSLVSLQSSVNELLSKLPTLDEVVSWWSDWSGHVLTVVNTWWAGVVFDLQGLIDSAFAVRESLWAGWQEWRDKVTEFFEDPDDWLYKAFDRIIERFW